jgi:hypothetical protein
VQQTKGTAKSKAVKPVIAKKSKPFEMAKKSRILLFFISI